MRLEYSCPWDLFESKMYHPGEGNGKPLLSGNFCLENPLQDHQESK